MAPSIDYRQAVLAVAAELARANEAVSLERLIRQTCPALRCDAAFLLEMTDELTAVCRFATPPDPMIESISEPALVEEALASGQCVTYREFRASDFPNHTLAGWGARSVAILPVAAGAGGRGAALVLAWRHAQDLPDDFRDAVAPVWLLLRALYPREKTERDLAEARERLSAILETIPQAVLFVDDDGERGWVNGPAAELFGLPAGLTSPLRISKAMRDFRATASNAAALQQKAAVLLRDARAEIRDWKWEFNSPRLVLDVSSRMTRVHGVVGRIWVLADITALTEANAALAMQEERWQLALEGTSDGIWDWNALTGEVFYSRHWKDMLGYAEDEIPNDSQVWESLVHPDDLERVKAELRRHLDRETPYYIAEYRIRCRDGSWKWVLARGKAVWDANGAPVRLVGAHSDVTERRRSEELLREARQAADEANSAKSQFLARMSHEIRTPMNAICGLSDLLSDTPLDGEQREYVRVFRTNAERLLRLINDILDLSKVEASALDLEISAFRLEDALRRVSDLFLAAAKQKNLALNVTVLPGIPAAVRGDPDRLEQILVNLVGNALKFTEQGSVSVLVAPGTRPGHVAFEVRDTGPGIRADQIGAIFEPFVQADSGSTRKHTGTGLGLAIAKKLVEKMGGEIGVESEPGKGSCFRFTVYLEPELTASAILPAVKSQPDTTEELPVFDRPAKLLIAEDVEDNRFVLHAYLRGLPFELDFAEDGAIALRKAFAQAHDLILMDMQMPELDGFAVTRHIRAYEASRRKKPVPIIALTAFALSEEASRCIEAGCTDYLAKPLRKSDLLKTISRHLPRPASETRPIHADPLADDPDYLSSAVRELMPDYLANCAEQSENMVAWLEAGDFTAIERLGHNLKGSGGMMGLPKITEIGAGIHDLARAKDAEGLRGQLRSLRAVVAEGRSAFDAG
jgi:PAS domain S-box-containing protein